MERNSYYRGLCKEKYGVSIQDFILRNSDKSVGEVAELLQMSTALLRYYLRKYDVKLSRKRTQRKFGSGRIQRFLREEFDLQHEKELLMIDVKEILRRAEQRGFIRTSVRRTWYGIVKRYANSCVSKKEEVNNIEAKNILCWEHYKEGQRKYYYI